MARQINKDCEGFHRRDFLRLGAAGLFGLSLPELLELEARGGVSGAERKADAVILVWLAGGPATIDMWDLKPDAPEGIRGEFKPISTSAPGVAISQHLPKLAAVGQKFTLVRSLYHTIPSHGPATLFMTTGNKPTPALEYPAIGSLIAKLYPPEHQVPPYVSFSDLRGGLAGQAGYLGTRFNPFGVEATGAGKNGVPSLRVRGVTLPDGFSLAELENRDRLLDKFDQGLRSIDSSSDLVDGLDAFHKKALDILRSDRTRNAFDLAMEKPAALERYGRSPFGQGALAARRLVEAGVRFVTVSLGGWDTHGQNFQALSKRLLPELDRTLSALIADLDERGMLERTVVYCAGEFGRTPKINKNAGRDHWARSLAVLLAGGGFRPGVAFGGTDAHGMAPATDACTPDDVCSTIFRCLGIDPYQELKTSTGRSVALFREGKVIDKLI